MRIVHTRDWYAGRLWKNHRRLDVLGTLGNLIAPEAVDLFLV